MYCFNLTSLDLVRWKTSSRIYYKSSYGKKSDDNGIYKYEKAVENTMAYAKKNIKGMYK